MGGYSTMSKRSETGHQGIAAVLEEIRGYVQAEREKISAEPLLTERLCRVHLPRIEEMQACQLFTHSLSPLCRDFAHSSVKKSQQPSHPPFQEAGIRLNPVGKGPGAVSGLGRNKRERLEPDKNPRC